MVLVFALLLSIAAKAGFLGIPLAVIITSWFFKYAYILFDHTACGYQEPPTLDIQMLNPVDEQRPLVQVAILALMWAAVQFAQRLGGSAAAVIVGTAAVLLLPASIAVLGLERNLFKAAYPVALVKMVAGLGPAYALVLAVIAGYAIFIALLAKWELYLPVQIA